jgi:hypothetical protein
MGRVDPTMRKRGGRSEILLFRRRRRLIGGPHPVGAAVSLSMVCELWERVLSRAKEYELQLVGGEMPVGGGSSF